MKTKLQKQFEEQTPSLKSDSGIEYLQTFITWLHFQVEKLTEPQVSEIEMEMERIRVLRNDTWVDTASFKFGFKKCWQWLQSHHPKPISDTKIYIRFGVIPSDEKSKIYNGEVFVGYEEGVSVYEAVIIGKEYRLLFPYLTYSSCVSLSGCIDRKAYIVKGNEVGIGSDGEPLLRNVEIIKEFEI
jgi:hypothetical protein